MQSRIKSFHSDHIGSTSLAMNADGSWLGSVRYKPWGVGNMSSGTTPTATASPTVTLTPTPTATPTSTATSTATPTGLPPNAAIIQYTYDPLNRLKAADYNNGTYFHYSYDPVGNLSISY